MFEWLKRLFSKPITAADAPSAEKPVNDVYKAMTTYIHYGTDHFYPHLFMPIRNGDWRLKPADGTGLSVSEEQTSQILWSSASEPLQKRHRTK